MSQDMPDFKIASEGLLMLVRPVEPVASWMSRAAASGHRAVALNQAPKYDTSSYHGIRQQSYSLWQPESTSIPGSILAA